MNMHPKKTAYSRQFGTRIRLMRTGFGAVGIIALVAGCLGYPTYLTESQAVILAFSGIAIIFAGGAWISYVELRRFYCPACKKHIPTHNPTNGLFGVPIVFYCSACNVDWDTGIKSMRSIS